MPFKFGKRRRTERTDGEVSVDLELQPTEKKVQKNAATDSVSVYKRAKSSDDVTINQADEVIPNTDDDSAPKATSKKKKMKYKDMSFSERLHSKLDTSYFRYLNEQLYTNPSHIAREIIDDEKFHVYHQGYRNQVARWPIDPLDRVVSYCKKKGSTAVIADFGCGDARLSEACTHCTVHSFDLIAMNDRVTVADMANVPLSNNSVDVAVFCLSLMGTNLVDFLIEANRVLKVHGKLLIAEVKSRFADPQKFLKDVEKIGFRIKNKDFSDKLFLWYEFSKNKTTTDPSQHAIELKPCLYKKR